MTRHVLADIHLAPSGAYNRTGISLYGMISECPFYQEDPVLNDTDAGGQQSRNVLIDLHLLCMRVNERPLIDRSLHLHTAYR
jgi:hypothetical protein